MRRFASTRITCNLLPRRPRELGKRSRGPATSSVQGIRNEFETAPPARGPAKLRKAFSQRIVDDFLEAGIFLSADSINRGSDIVIERQGRAHPSKHKSLDAMMQAR